VNYFINLVTENMRLVQPHANDPVEPIEFPNSSPGIENVVASFVKRCCTRERLKAPSFGFHSVRLLVAFAIVFVALEPAAAAAKRIAVLPPTGAGPKDAAVSAKIVRALKHAKIKVVAGKRVQKAIEKEGSPSVDSDFVRVARNLKVEGVVASTLSREGRKATIEVTVRNGADGSVAGQETFVAKGPPKRLAKVVAGSFWKKLGPAVNRTTAPGREAVVSGLLAPPVQTEGGLTSGRSEPTSPVASTGTSTGTSTMSGSTSPPTMAPSTTAPAGEVNVASGETKRTKARDSQSESAGNSAEGLMVSASPEDRPTSAGDGLHTYEIEADLRTLRRTFDYSPTAAAPHYFLNFNPLAGGRASWYPIRYLGVFAQGEFGAGMESAGTYPTGTREIQGGAQFRYPFSFGQVGASAAYFHHAFLIQDTTAANDPSRLTLAIPNTVYAGARLAASARFRIVSRVHLTVDAAYRLVTTLGDGVGQVKSDRYFPTASRPFGLDGSAVLGVGIGSMFEIRGGVDYRRYSYGALQGTTLGGAMIDASGAVDQYFAISLGVAAVLK
jgi:hypothetical protein